MIHLTLRAKIGDFDGRSISDRNRECSHMVQDSISCHETQCTNAPGWYSLQNARYQLFNLVAVTPVGHGLKKCHHLGRILDKNIHKGLGFHIDGLCSLASTRSHQ